MKKIREKVLPLGKLGSYAVDERIWLQEQKLSGIFSGQEVPKTIFKLRWLRLPHNIGFNLTTVEPKNLREVTL